MNIKIYITYCLRSFFLLSVLFSFTSCEKEIDLKLNSSEPKIVIEGLIELDSMASVKITRSQDYNQTGGFPLVNNAVVTLSDNTGNTEVLEQNSKGIYVSKKIKGVRGTIYKLLVNVDGKDYTSTSTMPNLVKIESLFIYDIPAIKAVYPMIQFQDVSGKNNYYRVLLFINNKRIKISLDVTDDTDRDGVPINFLLSYDKDENGGQEIRNGDKITVYLQSIDKGAFIFFESLSRVGSTLNNPTSNITGGSLGYFSAYTSNMKSILVDSQDK